MTTPDSTAAILRLTMPLCEVLDTEWTVKLGRPFILIGPFEEPSHGVTGGHGVLSPGPYNNGVPGLLPQNVKGHTTYDGVGLLGL